MADENEQGQAVPLATAITTKELGWPNSNLTIYQLNEEWYFETEAVMKEFGLKKSVESKGYKGWIDNCC